METKTAILYMCHIYMCSLYMPGQVPRFRCLQRVQALRVARHRDHHHCVSNAGRRGEGTPSGKAAGTKYLRCDATYNRIARNTCTNCVRSQTRIVREKERERPPKAALQTAKGRRTGGVPGGGPGGVKGTGDFVPKSPYLMQFL